MNKLLLIFNYFSHFPVPIDVLKKNNPVVSGMDNGILETADIVFFHLPTLLDVMPDELEKEDHQLWVGWRYEHEETVLWLNPEIDAFLDLYICFKPRFCLWNFGLSVQSTVVSSLLYAVLRSGNPREVYERVSKISYDASLLCWMKYRWSLLKRCLAHPFYYFRQKVVQIKHVFTEAAAFPHRKKVDFMLIGTQKGGTTSLHDYLCQHPECMGSKAKEPMFFLYPCVYDLGFKWYRNLWMNARPVSKLPRNCLLFESSTWYSYWPEVAGKLFEYNPGLKFIFLVRNPIDRAYSQYNMLIQRDKKQLLYEYHLFQEEYDVKQFVDQLLDIPAYPFSYWARLEMRQYSDSVDATVRILPDFLHRGIYCNQLENFYKYFKKEQILIINSRELKNSRVETLRKVESFLNVSHMDWSGSDLEEKHISYYTLPFPVEIRQELQRFFEPYNKKLYDMIGQDLGWN